MATVYARRSAGVGRPGGGVTYVTRGEAYDDKHPVVRLHPDLFGSEPPELAGGRSLVERATAAPGEKRAVPAPKTKPQQ